MVDNKSKTKTAMLQELESIKGLLREDDGIPILQEVITEHTDNHHSGEKQPPLKKRDLQELHQQFEKLSQTIAGSAVSDEVQIVTPHSKTPTSASLLDAFTQASRQAAPTTTVPAQQQQPSLFNTSDETFDQPTAEINEPDITDKPPDVLSKTHPENDEYHRTLRPSLAKASGENPFLPQHIRERLHGNNPPPLFDFSVNKNVAAPKTKPLQEISMRQRLTNEIIEAIMPKVEQELRQRLDDLTEHELENLRDPD